MPSRGERNNNPGNLEASPWTKSQPGYIGSDGRFAKFDTLVNGMGAQVKLLTNSYIKKGYNTVNSVINRYGNDPGTGDDKSVANYKKYVAGRLGVGLNDPISAAQVPMMAEAMREFETGNTKSGVLDTLSDVFNYDPLANADGTERDLLGDLGIGISKGVIGQSIAVFIGIILIGLAIAAFVFKSDAAKNIVQSAIPAAG